MQNEVECDYDCVQDYSLVQYIFNDNCTRCHDPYHPNGLALTSYEMLMNGAITSDASDPSIVPFYSDSGKVMQMISDEEMPKDGEQAGYLTNDEIGIITKWIEQGARPPSSELANYGCTDYNALDQP